MREIALHLLDLAENSVSAGAQTVIICVCEDLRADRLTASVEDDGRGMDAETVKRVTDPFYTSRTTRKVGLGIPLLKGAAEECNGSLTVASTPGVGTLVDVNFPPLAMLSAIPRIRLTPTSGRYILTTSFSFDWLTGRWFVTTSRIAASTARSLVKSSIAMPKKSAVSSS